MTLDNLKFAFATKNNKTYCIAYDNYWEHIWWEKLMDNQFTIKPASKQHWTRKIDEIGQPIETYILDDQTEFFDLI